MDKRAALIATIKAIIILGVSFLAFSVMATLMDSGHPLLVGVLIIGSVIAIFWWDSYKDYLDKEESENKCKSKKE